MKTQVENVTWPQVYKGLAILLVLVGAVIVIVTSYNLGVQDGRTETSREANKQVFEMQVQLNSAEVRILSLLNELSAYKATQVISCPADYSSVACSNGSISAPVSSGILMVTPYDSTGNIIDLGSNRNK